MATLAGTEYHTERIDGHDVQKPLPKFLHAAIQMYLLRSLADKLPAAYRVLPELNVLCKDDRLVPDITVAARSARYVDGDLADGAALCVEIMSPGQTLSSLFNRAERLLKCGTAMCWIILPEKRQAWMYTADGLSEAAESLTFRFSPEETVIAISAADLWASV
jgi:Uma2 family endonuclease